MKRITKTPKLPWELCTGRFHCNSPLADMPFQEIMSSRDNEKEYYAVCDYFVKQYSTVQAPDIKRKLKEFLESRDMTAFAFREMYHLEGARITRMNDTNTSFSAFAAERIAQALNIPSAHQLCLGDLPDIVLPQYVKDWVKLISVMTPEHRKELFSDVETCSLSSKSSSYLELSDIGLNLIISRLSRMAAYIGAQPRNLQPVILPVPSLYAFFSSIIRHDGIPEGKLRRPNSSTSIVTLVRLSLWLNMSIDFLCSQDYLSSGCSLYFQDGKKYLVLNPEEREWVSILVRAETCEAISKSKLKTPPFTVSQLFGRAASFALRDDASFEANSDGNIG